MNARAQALVIEDDEDLNLIFSEALAAAGYQPEILVRGDEALRHLQQPTVQPRMIVLDLHLPNVNGLEILAWIRRAPHLKNTRVAVVSADPRMAEAAREEPLSADLVLIKPVEYALLRDLASRFQLLLQDNPGLDI